MTERLVDVSRIPSFPNISIKSIGCATFVLPAIALIPLAFSKMRGWMRVDVLNSNKAVLHTYPITIGAPNITSNDTEYETKAAKAAAHAQLVPDADLKNLTSRMHVSRGGALAPYGDDRSVLSETKQSLDQVVRERAYLLWEKDGCQHDRSEEYWHLAHDQRLRERAYVLWRQEGCPEGRAEEQWHRSRRCETP